MGGGRGDAHAAGRAMARRGTAAGHHARPTVRPFRRCGRRGADAHPPRPTANSQRPVPGFGRRAGGVAAVPACPVGPSPASPRAGAAAMPRPALGVRPPAVPPRRRDRHRPAGRRVRRSRRVNSGSARKARIASASRPAAGVPAGAASSRCSSGTAGKPRSAKVGTAGSQRQPHGGGPPPPAAARCPGPSAADPRPGVQRRGDMARRRRPPLLPPSRQSGSSAACPSAPRPAAAPPDAARLRPARSRSAAPRLAGEARRQPCPSGPTTSSSGSTDSGPNQRRRSGSAGSPSWMRRASKAGVVTRPSIGCPAGASATWRAAARPPSPGGLATTMAWRVKCRSGTGRNCARADPPGCRPRPR